ncbi:MAG: trypsin-like peptidase domain-containing protein, partial [Thermomicrobiales bacterium]|nr:trypsin-like peptidase domain-containing protein [Thermomicrobiales bacterium]
MVRNRFVRSSLIRFAMAGLIALVAIGLASSAISPPPPEPPVVIEHEPDEIVATTFANLETDARRADLDRPMSDQEVSARSIAAVEAVAPAVVVVRRIGDADTPESIGSGVAIDSRGHVLASLGTTGETGEIRVTWPTGETAPAQIVRIDPRYRVVLLRAEGGPPAFATLAGYPVRSGDRVLAIGSPLEDFNYTVTAGIAGAIGVTLPGVGDGPGIPDLIQHDAATNPGNEGGPIVDLNGNVVGINIGSIVQEQDDLVQG